MPKLRTPNCRPTEPRQRLTNELWARFGGALTLTDIMNTLGYNDQPTTKRWIKVNGLEAVTMASGRKKWLVSDVARALDNSKVMDG